MSTKRFTKFAVGDLVYRYPSTKQRQGHAGIATRVILGQEGDEPHVIFQRADGSDSPLLDCKSVGYGGAAPKETPQGLAIVKWLEDAATGKPPPLEESHFEWTVLQESNGWALARDHWDNRLHWLTVGSEYVLRVSGSDRYHKVTMQTLVK